MIDKETFLKPSLPEETISLPGVGDVRVRGLSRFEAVSLSTLKDDTAALECAIVRMGLVEPALSAQEASEWYHGAPAGLIDPIVNAVERLSGLQKGADKSGVHGVPRGSRS